MKTELQVAIEEIIGEYEPIEREVTNYHVENLLTIDASGNQEIQTVITEYQTTEAIFNWTWAAGVLLFTIVLYSLLRCIGGVLKWKL